MSIFDPLPRKYYTAPYAKAGVTPGWQKFKVFDRYTTKEIPNVVECNPKEGWLIYQVRNPDGSMVLDMDGEPWTRKIKGYFEIRLYS